MKTLNIPVPNSQVISKPSQRSSLGIFPFFPPNYRHCHHHDVIIIIFIGLDQTGNGFDERGEVVTLAEGNALLAQDIVGSDEVEEDVGKSSSTGPDSTGDVELVGRTDLGWSNGLTLGVDDVLVDALEGLGGSVKTRVNVGVGGNGVLELLGVTDEQAGDQALSECGDNVDLEGQGLHVRVDRGSEEALRVGLFLSNRDDIGERLDGALGGANSGIVQSERHCEFVSERPRNPERKRIRVFGVQLIKFE